MPTDEPLIPISIDDAIKKLYGPAMQEQLNRELPLLNMIAPEGRPIFLPQTRWERVKWWARWNVKPRINDIYMHTRYGYCDDAKEYDNHEC